MSRVVIKMDAVGRRVATCRSSERAGTDGRGTTDARADRALQADAVSSGPCSSPPRSSAPGSTDPRLRLADVRWYLGEPGRGRREYEAGHLPGAVFVDVDRELVARDGPGRHPLPEPVAFARCARGARLRRRHAIVAYDQGGGTIAALVVGHDRVVAAEPERRERPGDATGSGNG